MITNYYGTRSTIMCEIGHERSFADDGKVLMHFFLLTINENQASLLFGIEKRKTDGPLLSETTHRHCENRQTLHGQGNFNAYTI